MELYIYIVHLYSLKWAQGASWDAISLYICLYIYIYDGRWKSAGWHDHTFAMLYINVRTPTFAPPRSLPHVRTPTFAHPRSHTHVRTPTFAMLYINVRTPQSPPDSTYAPPRSRPQGTQEAHQLGIKPCTYNNIYMLFINPVWGPTFCSVGPALVGKSRPKLGPKTESIYSMCCKIHMRLRTYWFAFWVPCGCEHGHRLCRAPTERDAIALFDREASKHNVSVPPHVWRH